LYRLLQLLYLESF